MRLCAFAGEISSPQRTSCARRKHETVSGQNAYCLEGSGGQTSSLKSDIQPYEKIREYLLGKSTSEDSAFVEERLLADDEFYQQLLVVEDELVDQYLAGLLPGSEREPFENYFLASPQRRQKLRFTRNLKKYVSRAEAERAPLADHSSVVPVRADVPPAPSRPLKRFSFWSNPILSYSLAAAAVIVVALVGLVFWNSRSDTGKVLAVELVPGLTRGDETIKQIDMPADTGTVQLQLRAANISSYKTYRAILQTIAGSEISRPDNLRPDPASPDRIICPISATLLKPGDYSLKLSGLNQQGEYEDIARYYFRITQ